MKQIVVADFSSKFLFVIITVVFLNLNHEPYHLPEVKSPNQEKLQTAYIWLQHPLLFFDFVCFLVCLCLSHRNWPQAPSGLQPSEEDLRPGVAHHPLPEGRLAEAAAGAESCNVGRTRIEKTHMYMTRFTCKHIYFPFFLQHEPPETQLLTVQTEERDGVHAPEAHSQAGLLHHQPSHRYGQIPGADSHRDWYYLIKTFTSQLQKLHLIWIICSSTGFCEKEHNPVCQWLMTGFLHFLASEKLLCVWREMEQTAVSCGQVELSVLLHVCHWCFKKTKTHMWVPRLRWANWRRR